jgi:hypothetical protein
MAKILALIVFVQIFVPVAAFAQNQTETQDLITGGMIESDNGKTNIDNIRDIYESCRDAAFERNFSIIAGCVEITKAYNNVISELFSEHRNIVGDNLRKKI